jgi:spermidine synthase
LVLAAAAIVGFAFFLMELVWYRMLGPLLGGTVFTFGLILAVALLGIGVGGTVYSLNRTNRPATLRGFAYTCLLEAACIGIPFALGDRIAVLAVLLRPLGSMGFAGHVAAWSVITALVVLPAAFVAGVQFPFLIALMGPARRNVGSEIGLVYAWNTAGAICGSLAGGFGLIPALTAPGCWRAVVIILGVLGLSAAIISAIRENRWVRVAPEGTFAASVLSLALALGPTAAWRHSPIGAGRVDPQRLSDVNGIRDWLHSERLPLRWEAEGVESSVALTAIDGFSFIVNGKVDGNARIDAPTVVMGGLVGAMLHPKPKTALVIGLGTGSTAGWLAAVPDVDRVDAVELEPAILEVAKMCSAVNVNALGNPKVHIAIGDAREVLLTTPSKYDLIFSEPSNPYRAGVASLFTSEFYEGVKDRLNEAGIFMQWVQGYEVDGRTLRSVYATMGSVFPEVETWQLAVKDLLLVASRKPLAHDVSSLRARLQQEPFKKALAATWRVNDLEGFLAHHIAGTDLVRAISRTDSDYISTDDRNFAEFGFARDVGRHASPAIDQVQQVARELKTDRPVLANGDIDWNRFEERRLDIYITGNHQPPPPPTGFSSEQRNRIRALAESIKGNRRAGLAAWRAQSRDPETINEIAFLADALADDADSKAQIYIDQLRALQPTEADAILSRLYLRQFRISDAAPTLIAALTHFQDDPWPASRIMSGGLSLAAPIATADKASGERIFEVLQKPFPVQALEIKRIETLVNLSRLLNFKATCMQALKPFEPNVPWNAELLALRESCYQSNQLPNHAGAAADLDEFAAQAPFSFATGLIRTHPEISPGGTGAKEAMDGLGSAGPTSSPTQ